MTKKNLAKEAEKFLDDNDISTAYIIFKDPDSDLIFQTKRGQSLWLRGALEVAKEAIMKDWFAPNNLEEEW